jgi:septin family protein
MGFFSRRERIVDLTEDYKYERLRKDKLKSSSIPQDSGVPSPSQESSVGGFFNFFGGANTSSTPSTSSSSSDSSSASTSSNDSNEGGLDSYEKRRRLAMRLKNMTDRIEEQSNQIYLLQQRIDLLERRIKIGKYSEE